MRIKNDSRATGVASGQGLTAAGSLLGAVAVSSCCVLPLVLFGLGVSGAWIGNLTRLAPYQPYFIAATVAFLGWGYWLVYRSSTVACAEGCAQPGSIRLMKVALVAATVLVVVAVGFNLVAPLLLVS